MNEYILIKLDYKRLRKDKLLTNNDLAELWQCSLSAAIARTYKKKGISVQYINKLKEHFADIQDYIIKE